MIHRARGRVHGGTHPCAGDGPRHTGGHRPAPGLGSSRPRARLASVRRTPLGLRRGHTDVTRLTQPAAQVQSTRPESLVLVNPGPWGTFPGAQGPARGRHLVAGAGTAPAAPPPPSLAQRGGFGRPQAASGPRRALGGHWAFAEHSGGDYPTIRKAALGREAGAWPGRVGHRVRFVTGAAERSEGQRWLLTRHLGPPGPQRGTDTVSASGSRVQPHAPSPPAPNRRRKGWAICSSARALVPAQPRGRREGWGPRGPGQKLPLVSRRDGTSASGRGR